MEREAGGLKKQLQKAQSDFATAEEGRGAVQDELAAVQKVQEALTAQVADLQAQLRGAGEVATAA